MRRGTLAGVRPGRGRDATMGAGEGSLLCDDSDIDEGVGEGRSFGGIPCMFVAMAGVISGDQIPANEGTGVVG